MKNLTTIFLITIISLISFSQQEKVLSNTCTTVIQMTKQFKNILTEKGHHENQQVKDSLIAWSSINENVNWTENEKDQNRQHIEAIENRFTDKDELINRYLKLFSYKIKQQIQEEKESKEEQLPHNEILRILTFEKLLDDIAKIESYHIGNSDKLIILISQNHGPKEISQHIQDDIYEINKRLIENNICKTFAVENVVFKEMDDEKSLTFFDAKDTTDNKKYALTTSMRLEKDYGNNIFTSGVEDEIDKSDYRKIMKVFIATKKTSKYYKPRRELFQKKTINERNKMIFNNMLTILDNTRKNIITLKVGALHLTNNPVYYRHLPLSVADKKCLTIQEICKANNISYIHIIPKYFHY